MPLTERAKQIRTWLRCRVEKAGARGVVLGLSGGLDSALTAKICKDAFSEDTFALIMPCFSAPEDAEDAELVAKHLNLRTKRVNLDSTFISLCRELGVKANSVSGQHHNPDLALFNIKPRLRMLVLYYYAATLNYLVVGTSNRSEISIGYFTKYGDGGVDLLPLGGLLKTEVKMLAKELALPEKIVEKRPAAGLWLDHYDEEELGITYAELDRYLQSGQASEHVKDIVDTLIAKNRHKRVVPPYPSFNGGGGCH